MLGAARPWRHCSRRAAGLAAAASPICVRFA